MTNQTDWAAVASAIANRCGDNCNANPVPHNNCLFVGAVGHSDTHCTSDLCN